MKIIEERTRLIFTEYNDIERRRIEDIVATDDKAFTYEDPDNHIIAFPPGMKPKVKEAFPKINIEDHTKSYWEFARIDEVQHDMKPRNQLQIDCISFILDCANKKLKAAAIVSPGTGKGLPLTTKIPIPGSYKMIGDLKIGDKIFGSNGKATTVLGVYPQGERDIYQIKLVDGRTVLCDSSHLWTIKNLINKKIYTIELCKLLRRHYKEYAIPVDIPTKWVQIESIIYLRREETQCIYVDSDDHLYMIDQDIITHNTFMACYCAIKVGARTLMIAPTSGIKQQWADTLTDMFNVDPNRVKLVSRPVDFVNVKSDFVVVSQASLAVLNKTYNLEKIMKSNKFGIKIIDEVQMWWHNMIKIDGNSNICHNWYLTGTFGRSGEEENTIYQQMYGDLQMFKEKQKTPTIFNRKPGNIYGMKPHMHIKMLWGHSGLSKEEISSCMTSMRYSERAGKWVRYGISIAKHAELIIPSDGTMTKFLRLILNTIKEAEKQITYGKTLILGSTINSAEVVAAYIKKLFPDKKVYTYHSRNDSSLNAEAKEQADIMVSTISSAGTGFDWKGLSKLIVFAQYKSWILTDQISGRLRVRDDGKDTYMWDIVDADIKQLRAWASARADVEKRKAKIFKVVDV